MGKKKWTGPNERKRQHMHRGGGKGGRGGRGGHKSRGGAVNPLHGRFQRDQRNAERQQ